MKNCTKHGSQFRGLVGLTGLTDLPGLVPYEVHHVKTCFWHVRKHKAQISCAVTAQLISTFVFAKYEPCREKTGPWDF